ncbi:hypothetical protein [Iningainema tapete]|uniref:Uncharacterized protein n=1 Tax=Iningainema tapete BLCC-T55 TaxID=2748662 RepID=A0A8J7BWL7_9CYAN|nr:hypothetical protein [Iningainema tapete]MBD2771153.1 hypothetical protein [Iningainema tapete BLCC-T55]
MDDEEAWYKWISKATDSGKRIIACNRLDEDLLVVTMFIGIDVQVHEGGFPLLFETTINGGNFDGYQKRFSTYDQAEAEHAKIVKALLRNLRSVELFPCRFEQRINQNIN